ncbi:MAG: DUF448 domain-containing protein [Myxococcota bacterium]
MRRCAWTREVRPKDELLRLVLDPEDRVFVDVLGRAPGRGIYLSPDASVVSAALAPKGLGRLFRGKARGLGPLLQPASTQSGRSSSESPSEIIARLLERRAIELVALARRASQLEVGTDTVLETLTKDVGGSCLILARDVGNHTERRIRERLDLTRRVRLRVFSSKDRFAEALGRGPTGVLLARPGTMADRLAAEGRRLALLSGRAATDVLDPEGLHPEVDSPRSEEDIPSEDESGREARSRARRSSEPVRTSRGVEAMTGVEAASASRCSD